MTTKRVCVCVLGGRGAVKNTEKKKYILRLKEFKEKYLGVARLWESKGWRKKIFIGHMFPIGCRSPSPIKSPSVARQQKKPFFEKKKIINNIILIFYFSAPPSFEIKTRKQTALKGESTVLQCEAKGEKPIGNQGNLPFYSTKLKEGNLYGIIYRVTMRKGDY